MATVDLLDVLDGFRLPDTGGGDRRLYAVTLQDGQGFFVDLQGDNSLGADQTRPEGRALGRLALLRIEISGMPLLVS